MTAPGRAWQVHEHGEPADVLRLVHDVARPDPGEGEVVVRVAACALNFADALLCQGSYQEKPPFPFTPGLEVAGTVLTTGPGTSLAVGTRVAGSPVLPHGGLADHVVARATDVFPVPDDLDDVTAAAMHITYQTAWFALFRRAGLQPGETVLVHAGAGGMGSATIQLAVAAGAHVIATAGGPDKVAQCRALGAPVAVDYRTEDFVAVVNEQTGGRGADVIVDSVGGDTFVRSTRCIAWEGRLVVIGAAGGRYAEARTNHAMVKTYSILGLNWGGYRPRAPEIVARAHAELADLYRRGAVRPLVSETLPLDGDVPGAITRLTGGSTTGKLVVVP